MAFWYKIIGAGIALAILGFTVAASLLNSTSRKPSFKSFFWIFLIFFGFVCLLLVAYQAFSGALVLFVSMIVFEFAPEIIDVNGSDLHKMDDLKKGWKAYEPCGSGPYQNRPDFKLTTENGGTIEGFKSGSNQHVKFCPKEGDVKNFASYAGFSEHSGTMADLISKARGCHCANLSELKKD